MSGLSGIQFSIISFLWFPVQVVNMKHSLSAQWNKQHGQYSFAWCVFVWINNL